MQYIVGLWKAWEALRRHLYLSLANNSIPAQWRLSDLIFALHPFATFEDDKIHGLNRTLGKLGATLAVDLWDIRNSTWRDFEEKMQILRNILQWLKDLTSDFLTTLSSVKHLLGGITQPKFAGVFR